MLIFYRSSFKWLSNSAIILLNKAVHMWTYKRDFTILWYKNGQQKLMYCNFM